MGKAARSGGPRAEGRGSNPTRQPSGTTSFIFTVDAGFLTFCPLLSEGAKPWPRSCPMPQPPPRGTQAVQRCPCALDRHRLTPTPVQTLGRRPAIKAGRGSPSGPSFYFGSWWPPPESTAHSARSKEGAGATSRQRGGRPAPPLQLQGGTRGPRARVSMATWPSAPGPPQPLAGPGATAGLGRRPFAPELSPRPRGPTHLPPSKPARPPPGTPAAPTANLQLSERDYTSQTALQSLVRRVLFSLGSRYSWRHDASLLRLPSCPTPPTTRRRPTSGR
ncbi:hypothetical protein VULLAG_LOCUS3209 [Vulpes lagopus]